MLFIEIELANRGQEPRILSVMWFQIRRGGRAGEGQGTGGGLVIGMNLGTLEILTVSFGFSNSLKPGFQ